MNHIVVANKREAGTVKGSVLISLLKYIFKELNEQQKENFLSQIDQVYRKKIIENRILSTDRVDVSIVNKLTLIAASVKGKPAKVFAKDVGRFGAEEGMKSAFAIYSRIKTPNAQMGKASVMWSSLYDKGKMETIRVNKDTSIVQLTGIPTEEIMCERIYGWLERTNQIAGLEDVKVVHTKCCSFGQSHCEWQITWKK